MIRLLALAATLLAVTSAAGSADLPSPVHGVGVTVEPATMPFVETVDPRFQSYNVDMAQVMGVAPLRAPIDLSNPRVRTLANALGPAYVRVSGTRANSTYFQDSDAPKPAKPPKGFQNTLTRQEWRGVIDFARAVNAKVVTSFAVSQGVRDASGVWQSGLAGKWLDYTKAIGGEIAAAEMFDEPTLPAAAGVPAGYDAASYARDYAVFRPFIRKSARRTLIAGPGAADEVVAFSTRSAGTTTIATPDLLAARPRPKFDVFSYHSFGGASMRCVSMGTQRQIPASEALSEQWLARPDAINAFYMKLRNQYRAGRGAWVTETADTACGGNPWAATFLDTFRYLDTLGRLATHGVNVVFHNSLASNGDGLLEQTTFEPRPDYWGALLWHELMGPRVLNPGTVSAGVHAYAHCLPEVPGGVTLLLINTNRTTLRTANLSVTSARYTLTAQPLRSERVLLNGQELKLGANDALPELRGVETPPGTLTLAPASITFLAINDARNPDCR
jgi:heparanase 1